MSDTPKESHDEAPPPSDAEETPNEEPPMTPWYRRPGPLVGLIVLALILMVILPPVVADEVPVALSEQGRRNADQGGWERDGNSEASRLLGGLVLVDPVTLTRETNGIPTGVYVYTTVKVPAMLPRGVMSGQMHENALGLLQENGVHVDPDSARTEDYDGNGHDATVTYYKATAQNDDFFLHDTEVDLFIATWRCSLLGSWAVAVGAVPTDPVTNNGNGLVPGFGSGQGTQDDRSPLEVVERDLLAHTQCQD